MARKNALHARKILDSQVFQAYDAQISQYAPNIAQLLLENFPPSSNNLAGWSIGAFLPQTQEPGSRKLLQSLQQQYNVTIFCPYIPSRLELISSVSAADSPTWHMNREALLLADPSEYSPLLYWSRYENAEVTGRWNIPEPAPPYIPPQSPFQAMILPSLLLDFHGNRLGRGAGFYDRSLPFCANNSTLLIGLTFAEELLAPGHSWEWLTDPWDVPVHYSLSYPDGLQRFSVGENDSL